MASSLIFCNVLFVSPLLIILFSPFRCYFSLVFLSFLRVLWRTWYIVPHIITIVYLHIKCFNRGCLLFSQPKHCHLPWGSLLLLCRLHSLTSSITTQSSISVLESSISVLEVHCKFHCIFGTGMLPPPRQRPPPASPLVSIQLSEGDCCVSLKNMKNINAYKCHLPP